VLTQRGNSPIRLSAMVYVECGCCHHSISTGFARYATSHNDGRILTTSMYRIDLWVGYSLRNRLRTGHRSILARSCKCRLCLLKASADMFQTLSEVLNAVVAASAFDSESPTLVDDVAILTPPAEGSAGARQSIRTSLKYAGYRSLGSLAKNALFADLIDALVWPLSALDRGRPERFKD
jgi:hypothetical protein